MELTHSFTVPVPVPQAWEVLLDLEQIVECMPGASLTSHTGDEFAGAVRVKLGPVRMTFSGQGRFVEVDPQARRIALEASGKERTGGGSARAAVRAVLRPAGDELEHADADAGHTAVDVHTELAVTGRVAQFGQGMIAEVSTRLLGQFTECLAGRLAAGDLTGGQDAGQPVPEQPVAETASGASVAAKPAATDVATGETTAAPVSPGTAPASRQAEPIDLLAVTGLRAALGRWALFLLVFAGAAIAGAVVMILLL